MTYDGPGADDPGLPKPVSDTTASGTPEKPDSSATVEIPSEFGEDEPAPPDADEADADAVEPEAAPSAPNAPGPPPPVPSPQVTDQPATGVPPAQAIPGTPRPPHPSSQAPKKSSPWGWIIGCTCGGCLLLFLLLFGFGLVGYLVSEAEPEPPVSSTPGDTQSGPDSADATDTTSLGPGLSGVEEFAADSGEGWAFEVADHSPDWEQVTLHVGPTADSMTTWLQLAWDADIDAYRAVDDGAIDDMDGPADTPPATTGEPGEQLAKQTALAANPGWVAKVVRHSGDWRTAVIWVGPPQSEWVSEVRIRWSDTLAIYEIEGERYIGYDENEAP